MSEFQTEVWSHRMMALRHRWIHVMICVGIPLLAPLANAHGMNAPLAVSACGFALGCYLGWFVRFTWSRLVDSGLARESVLSGMTVETIYKSARESLVWPFLAAGIPQFFLVVWGAYHRAGFAIFVAPCLTVMAQYVGAPALIRASHRRGLLKILSIIGLIIMPTAAVALIVGGSLSWLRLTLRDFVSLIVAPTICLLVVWGVTKMRKRPQWQRFFLSGKPTEAELRALFLGDDGQ